MKSRLACLAVVAIAMFARLNALAVFAFSAAIARLPSHWSSGLLPLNATAQTNPWRFTTAAHSLLSKPPLLGPPPGLTLFWSLSYPSFSMPLFEPFTVPLLSHSSDASNNTV